MRRLMASLRGRRSLTKQSSINKFWIDAVAALPRNDAFIRRLTGDAMLVASCLALILHLLLLWLIFRSTLPTGFPFPSNKEKHPANIIMTYIYHPRSPTPTPISMSKPTPKPLIKTNAAVKHAAVQANHKPLLKKSLSQQAQATQLKISAQDAQHQALHPDHKTNLAMLLHDRLQASLTFPSDLPAFITARQVTVGFYLTPQGLIEKSAIVTGSGVAELDTAALTALQQIGSVAEAESGLNSEHYFEVLVIFRR